MYRNKRHMKKLLFIFSLLLLIADTVPVFAQEIPYIDVIKKYTDTTGHGTNCPDSKKDKKGNCNPACCKTNDDCKSNGPDQTCEIQNGECGSGTSCLDPHDPTQACVAEGKKDKYGNYNPACCINDTDCPGDQTCTIGNNFCKSGNSCDPNGHRTSTTPPGTPSNGSPSNGGSSTTPPNSGPASGRYKTTFDNFPYYCQGDDEWRWINGLDQSGCGPTSLAMIITKFGIPMIPPQVDTILHQNLWRSGSNGLSNIVGAISSSWFKNQLGFVVGPDLVSNGEIDVNRAKTFLNQGYLIIGSAKVIEGSTKNYTCGGGCTGTYANHPLDHMMVIDQVDSRNKVRVRDSSNCIWPSKKINPNNGQEVLDDKFLFRPAYQINFFAYPVKRNQ